MIKIKRKDLTLTPLDKNRIKWNDGITVAKAFGDWNNENFSGTLVSNSFKNGWYSLFSFPKIGLAFLCLLMMASCAGTKSSSRSQKTQMVVTQARSYVGVPYKYGGTTVLGMDCSGLLMRSFEAIDVYIPRSAAAQSKAGKPVGLEIIRPGDLVFFAGKKRSRKVTHAGLVTEVRSRNEIIFIHASTSRGVVEANLMSPYYQKIFIKARRIKF